MVHEGWQQVVVNILLVICRFLVDRPMLAEVPGSGCHGSIPFIDIVFYRKRKFRQRYRKGASGFTIKVVDRISPR